MNNDLNKKYTSELNTLIQFITAQSKAFEFDDEAKLGKFIINIINKIPAIDGCIIFFRSSTYAYNMSSPEFIKISETLKNIPASQNHFSIKIPQNIEQQIFSIKTLERSYGYLILSAKNYNDFHIYKPAINNFINMIAVCLENNWLKKQSVNQNLHPDNMVKKRMSGLKTETANQKQTKLKEYKSEDRFNNINEIAIRWTDEIYRILEIPLGTKITVKSFMDYVYADDKEKIQNLFDLIIKSKQIDSEFRVIVDKKIKWIRILIAYFEAGIINSTTEVIVITQDITSQKHTELKLQESEQRFKALFNATFGGIVIHDNGLILDCNRGMADITGYTVEELIGMDALLLVEEKDRKKVKANIYAKNEKPYEVIGRRKNGEQYMLRIEARQILYKGKDVRVVELRDVTEKEKAQKALKESRKHYFTLFNESPISLWDTDFSLVKKYIEELKKQGIIDLKKYFDEKPEELIKIARLFKVINLNKATLKLHEAQTKEEFLNELEKTVFANESYTALKEGLVAIAIGKTKYEYEGAVRTLKGNIRHIQLRWNVLPEYKDSFKKVFISIIDITDRDKMIERIREERNKAKQYLNIAEVMLVSIDLSGIVKLINNKGCEILGYSKEEIIGQNWFDKFLPEQIKEEIKEYLKKMCTQKVKYSNYHENKIITKAGDEKLIAWHNTVYRDKKGNILGTLSSGEDITERRIIEERLYKSEDRLSKTLMAVNDGIWDWDLVTNNVYLSPQYYQMIGYNIDEFPHRLDECRKRIHPEDINKVTNQAVLHIKGEVPEFNIDFRIKQKNGEWLWVMGRGKIVDYDKNNKPIRFIGTHTDITKRKQAEEKLKKYRKHLEQLVEKRTKELEQKNKKLNDQMKVFVGRELKIKDMEKKIRLMKQTCKDSDMLKDDYLVGSR